MATEIPPPNVDSQSLPNLPPDIIASILSRLPVKSLLQFRCVSKSWHSLISHPKFAKTHFSLAHVNADYTHHRLILKSEYSPNDIKSCSLHSILNEQSDTAVELDFPSKVRNLNLGIWGSCDGLVCLEAGTEVFIWNPSTRKSKKLPIAETRYPHIVRYGFGYDESIDDYKVVGFFSDVGNSCFVRGVKVYTLRSDMWKKIGDFPYALPKICTFVNKALHWTASSDSNDIIVSFDLTKGSYGEVLEPEYRDGYWDRRLLDVLNRCLCILYDYGDSFDVWVMKEYGIRETWTKFVVIPYGTHPWGYPYPIPLCILKNGKILLGIDTHIIQYNPKDGTYIDQTIHNCSECFSAHPYVESLVAPDIDADSGFQRQHQY